MFAGMWFFSETLDVIVKISKGKTLEIASNDG